MIRSWGYQTLSGSAQPLFSDVTTADFVAPRANTFSPLKVGDTSKYELGDRIIIGIGSAGQNVVMVAEIPDATTLNVVSESNYEIQNWPSGTKLQLNIECSQILLTAAATNSGDTYVGSDDTVTSAGAGTAFTLLNAGGSLNIGLAQYNAVRTSEAWVAGPAAGKIGVAAIVI